MTSAPDTIEFILPPSAAGLQARIPVACSKYIASMDKDQGDARPVKRAKAHAKMKAPSTADAAHEPSTADAAPKLGKTLAVPKAVRKTKAKAAQMPEPHLDSKTMSIADGGDCSKWCSQYDFPDGGKTPDGKTRIRAAVRGLLTVFAKYMKYDLVQDGVVVHPDSNRYRWALVVHRCLMYFEHRYRHSTGHRPQSNQE